MRAIGQNILVTQLGTIWKVISTGEEVKYVKEGDRVILPSYMDYHPVIYKDENGSYKSCREIDVICVFD
jgi:hypothetical protein